MYVKKNYIKLSAEFNLSRVRNTNQMQSRARSQAPEFLRSAAAFHHSASRHIQTCGAIIS